MNNEHLYVLILAGGSGQRFWPLSRNARPKQLLDLFGSGSMLSAAVRRVAGSIPPERVFILTNALQREEVLRQAEGVPAENVIAEPTRRDTAPAVALGIGLIAARDPQACMMVLPSDALIGDDAAFSALAQDALALAARENALITIGIRPTWPCPSYGYIERTVQLEDPALSHTCYEVAGFREKPSREQAEQYLATGRFCWNAGIFVWSVAHVRAQLAKHAPQLAEFVSALAAADDAPAFIAEHFPQLTPISIDFALMEKADRVLNFEATFPWDDVGSWISVGKYLPHDAAENAANTPLVAQDAAQNIVFSAASGKQVALLGVSDLIVVDSGDALLIARKSDADRIKLLTPQLPPELL
ncbi:MAG: NTP transferase domain-containing protein [Akkermansiaceae bacterium]|nr:NTP transferase domain-containing protein [Akkermansiaceae bacterium]